MLLFINSIAGSEIVVILLFVLIFFGSKSIPGMARGLGKGMRQIKDASQDIQDEIRKTTTDMKRDVNINRALHEAKSTFESPLKDFTADLKKSATEIGENIDKAGEDTIEMKRDSNINKALQDAKTSIESPLKEFTADLEKSAIEIEEQIEGKDEESPSKNIAQTSDLKEPKLDVKPDQQTDI